MGLYLFSYDRWEPSSKLWREHLKTGQFDLAKLKDAKIYRFPNLTLPREKLNVIHEKYGSRTVRDKDIADLCIISTKYFNGITESLWKTPQFKTKQQFLDFYSDSITKNIFTKETIEYIDKFISSIEDNAIISIDGSYYWSGNQSDTVATDWFKEWTDNKKGDGYCYYIKSQNIDNYLWMQENNDILIFDDEVVKESTADSVILNVEEYERLHTMIKSQDKDNCSLALEIMANCNIEDSRTFLALLFYFNSETMKYATGWNHINVKSLRKQLAKYVAPGGYFANANTYDHLIRHLADDDILTEYAVRVISKEMFLQVLSNTFGLQSKGVFKIDPSILVLKDEFRKKIKHTDLVSEPALPF
jgi:hypothetical protein